MEKYPIKIWSHDYDNTIKLDVFCIDRCNYSCPYCFNMKGGYVRTNKELDLNKVYDFAIWLNEKTNKHIKISLIGGEPTLHPQFVEFSQKTKDNNNLTVLSFSNFAKPYEFFNTTLKNNVKYLLTFHYLNQQRANDFFIKLEKIEEDNLMSNIDTINVMLLKDNFDICLDIYDKLFKKYGNKVRCNLIDDCDKDNIKQLRQQNYTKTQLDDYKYRCSQAQLDNDNIVVYNDGSQQEFNDYSIKNCVDYNFKHWKCNAGKDYFSIDINGRIYPCNNMKVRLIATLDSYECVKFKQSICLTSKCPCEYGLQKKRVFK